MWNPCCFMKGFLTCPPHQVRMGNKPAGANLQQRRRCCSFIPVLCCASQQANLGVTSELARQSCLAT